MPQIDTDQQHFDLHLPRLIISIIQTGDKNFLSHFYFSIFCWRTLYSRRYSQQHYSKVPAVQYTRAGGTPHRVTVRFQSITTTATATFRGTKWHKTSFFGSAGQNGVQSNHSLTGTLDAVLDLKPDEQTAPTTTPNTSQSRSQLFFSHSSWTFSQKRAQLNDWLPPTGTTQDKCSRSDLHTPRLSEPNFPVLSLHWAHYLWEGLTTEMPTRYTVVPTKPPGEFRYANRKNTRVHKVRLLVAAVGLLQNNST